MSRPAPGILDPAELDAVRAAFGVAEIQVRRDHLISHTLAAIATVAADEIVFFGGTARCAGPTYRTIVCQRTSIS